MSRNVGKPALWILTRSYTNKAVQPLEMARGLKFCIKEAEVLYYQRRKNKGAELRLCFRICKMLILSQGSSYVNNIWASDDLRRIMRNSAFVYAKADQRHCFSPHCKISLALDPKFQAYSHMLSLYSQVWIDLIWIHRQILSWTSLYKVYIREQPLFQFFSSPEPSAQYNQQAGIHPSVYLCLC